MESPSPAYQPTPALNAVFPEPVSSQPVNVESPPPAYDTLGAMVGYFRQLYFSTTYRIFLYSIALLCWLCAAITSMCSYSPDLWQGYILEKRKGIGNRFTEKGVIKIIKRFCEKFLICFQMKLFAFPRTWLSSYMSLDESHVFSFLKKSFSMQIKNFSWGLSSEKKEFSWKKSYFYPHIVMFYTV